MASSPHFSDKELACPCCGVNLCTERLVESLEKLRALIGKSISLNSAYRCPIHNKKVGGEPNSQHIQGAAADIRVEGLTPGEIYHLALQIPEFAGFGVAHTFIHVDVRQVASHAKWCYGANGKQCAWDPSIDEIVYTAA